MTKIGDTGISGANGSNRPDTLDRLLRHCAERTSLTTALIDPPNRNALEGRSDGFAGRQFNFKNLDLTVTRVANRLTSIGLQDGDYVLLQMPNFIETPILVLALMRAGLIPCLIPLSWSIEDIARSFERLKPSALISCGQVEGTNYSEKMRELAFSHQHVRFVLGSGYNIADGVNDISTLFDPQIQESEGQYPQSSQAEVNNDSTLDDLALVTYIDPVTPVPHNNGQILATGLLHVLSLGLSQSDHILSAYPLSSIPGLAAHFTPWLMTGCSMSLHQPFQFNVLQEQLQSTKFSFFAAPKQVIDWLLDGDLPAPPKLAIVRIQQINPMSDIEPPLEVQLFSLWNLGGLGSIPTKYRGEQADPLFSGGRLCLPSTDDKELCLAGAKIIDNRLHIKGRIFPGNTSIKTSLEWFSLKKRFDADWLDTGMPAQRGPDNSILLGGKLPTKVRKTAS